MLTLKTFFVLTMLTAAGYSIVFACLDNFRERIGRKPLYALLFCYAGALFLPTLYLTYLSLFLVSLFFARSRNETFAIFLICFIMMPALHDIVQISSAYLFDLSAQTALSLGALCSLKLRDRTHRTVLPKNHYFFAIILTCLLIIAVRGTNLTAFVRGTAIILIQLGLPYAVFLASCRKPDFPARITVLLTLAGGMLATIAIFETLTSWPIFAVMNQHLSFQPSLLVAKFRGGHLRSAGPMLESTELGFILVFCLLAAIASRRIFRQTSGYAMTIGLVAVGLLGPQSKGGWIGAGLGIIALSLYRTTLAKPGKFIFANVAVLTLLFLASAYRPDQNSQASAVYRARLLQRGLEEFWRSPLLGDNEQSVLLRLQDLKQGEHIVDFVNSYLYFALTLGAFGLFAVVIAFLIPVIRAWRMRQYRDGDGGASDFRAFCFSAFISSIVMFALTSFILRAVILLMLFSLALIRRPRRTGAAPAPAVKTGRIVKQITAASPKGNCLASAVVGEQA